MARQMTCNRRYARVNVASVGKRRLILGLVVYEISSVSMEPGEYGLPQLAAKNASAAQPIR